MMFHRQPSQGHLVNCRDIQNIAVNIPEAARKFDEEPAQSIWLSQRDSPTKLFRQRYILSRAGFAARCFTHHESIENKEMPK